MLIIIFSGCSCLAYLVFGPVLVEFKDLGHSFQTCFNMLAFQAGLLDGGRFSPL